MARAKTCTICKATVQREFQPMHKWNLEGPICGDCYSKKIYDYYPGEHVRVNRETD